MRHPKTPATTGACFRLLSACFYEPEKELFQEQQVCHNLAHLLESFSPVAAAHARDMVEKLNSQDQQQLVIDYSALFIGPFELLAPPYGSVYLEKKREVMGDSTMKVLSLYQDAGLQSEVSEPADHIAIELEFIAYLHDREADALQNTSGEEAARYSELRKRFFFDCMVPWIPEFCETVKKGTDNPFYQTLADCLNAFIHSYRQRIVETGIPA